MVPRVIQGQAAESEVINGVHLIFAEGLDLFVEMPAAEEAGAEEELPERRLPELRPRVIVRSGAIEELVYGFGSNAADARNRFEIRLRYALQELDRICELTDAQKKKLELAGRGDIKRRLDRVEELREECDHIGDPHQFHAWAEKVKSEGKAFWRLFDGGPLDSRSHMAKCMKSTLTAEQLAKYARFEATPPYQPPDRKSLRFGGAIEVGAPR